MAPATTDAPMADASPKEKLELKLQQWNSLVSDETQCMTLSHEDEIKLLSSRDTSLAKYLKVHPEMAHELMVPAGFKQCLVRRYERYLSGEMMLSTQNGAAEEARWDEEIFNSMLPGKPTLIANPQNEKEPDWHELNAFICRNGVDTVSGEELAPHYEYVETGQRVRIISYRSMKVEVTAKQWHLMWDHVVCGFAGLSGAKNIEFSALHDAWREISSIANPWNEWKWPIGQQIAILLKQLEHRLRGAHVGRPNPCSPCCPFRPISVEESLAPAFRVCLSKAEAASIVCHERMTRKQPVFAVNYDPYIRAVLEKKGVECLPEGSHCSFVADEEWESE